MDHLTSAVLERAGFRPGEEIALAVDVASSHFFTAGRYALIEPPLTPAAMAETIAGWLDRYPIVSVEDGLAEDDWAHWPTLRRRLTGRALTLGDDLLCTNPARIGRAIEGLEGEYPGLKERLCDEQGELRRFVNVYVNGEDVRFLSGLTTPLKQGDEIKFFDEKDE